MFGLRGTAYAADLIEVVAAEADTAAVADDGDDTSGCDDGTGGDDMKEKSSGVKREAMQ